MLARHRQPIRPGNKDTSDMKAFVKLIWIAKYLKFLTFYYKFLLLKKFSRKLKVKLSCMCPPIYHDFCCVIMLCTQDEYDFCDVDLSLYPYWSN